MRKLLQITLLMACLGMPAEGGQGGTMREKRPIDRTLYRKRKSKLNPEAQFVKQKPQNSNKKTFFIVVTTIITICILIIAYKFLIVVESKEIEMVGEYHTLDLSLRSPNSPNFVSFKPGHLINEQDWLRKEVKGASGYGKPSQQNSNQAGDGTYIDFETFKKGTNLTINPLFLEISFTHTIEELVEAVKEQMKTYNITGDSVVEQAKLFLQAYYDTNIKYYQIKDPTKDAKDEVGKALGKLTLEDDNGTITYNEFRNRLSSRSHITNQAGRLLGSDRTQDGLIVFYYIFTKLTTKLYKAKTKGRKKLEEEIGAAFSIAGLLAPTGKHCFGRTKQSIINSVNFLGITLGTEPRSIMGKLFRLIDILKVDVLPKLYRTVITSSKYTNDNAYAFQDVHENNGVMNKLTGADQKISIPGAEIAKDDTTSNNRYDTSNVRNVFFRFFTEKHVLERIAYYLMNTDTKNTAKDRQISINEANELFYFFAYGKNLDLLPKNTDPGGIFSDKVLNRYLYGIKKDDPYYKPQRIDDIKLAYLLYRLGVYIIAKDTKRFMRVQELDDKGKA